jgi:hypothetical protein
LSVAVNELPSVSLSWCCADCLYVKRHFHECRFAEFRFGECHDGQCYYAESSNVVIVSFVKLCVIILNVIGLNVVAPATDFSLFQGEKN